MCHSEFFRSQGFEMVRRYVVEEKPIFVADQLLTQASIDEYVAALDGAPFTRTESATPETRHQRHFVSEMPMANLPYLSLYQIALETLQINMSAEYRAYRAYTNLALPGDVLYSHFDCMPGQRDCTALWYLCRTWEREWGGETVFFDSMDEISLGVLPRPGRLALFDGRIRHAGRAPSRIALEPRYTFAIKFERV
jgi:SM-20-related protein